ncbi:MAG: MFS transporter, partial [Candidatus Thermoplasmatota archaeon]|nr:MFS transporter [Candidatus Thermoplasmatota archaeon]
VSFGAAAIYIGMFFGSIIFGRISDSRGRRKIFVYDMALSSIFLFLTSFSSNLMEFFIFEVIAGIGIGADYPISSSIQAEFSPRKTRGRYLVFNIFSWTIGSVVFYVISIPIVLYSGDFAWRLMYATGAVIPVLVILSRRSLPESPYWLSEKGKYTEAEKVTGWMGGEIGIKALPAPSVERGKTSFSEIGKFFPLILFTSLAWLSYDIASYGVWNYTPSLFIRSGGGYVYAIIATLLEELPVVAGTLICLIYVDRIGRKKLESIGFGFAGISLVLFGLFSLHGSFPFLYIFAAFALMHFFHNIGPTNITYLYPVEIFPTRIRATAMGISTAASRVGAILGVFAFPLLINGLSISYGLLFFAVFEFIGLATTVILAPETRNKSLQ